MPCNIEKEDIRITKTVKALKTAMFSLLKHQNFRNITVKNLCEEALTSRATFYTHFVDKYELLEYCLQHLETLKISKDDSYEQIEKVVNRFVDKNRAEIKNLVTDADSETVGLLTGLMLSMLDMVPEENKKNDPKNMVLSNFYAGGMVSYISWQINDRHASDTAFMNRHLYKIIKKFQAWQFE